MPCRPIYCPTSEPYRYDGIPLRRHVDHSISIDIDQRHWQILMKKTPFRYRFNKGYAMLDRHIGGYQMI